MLLTWFLVFCIQVFGGLRGGGCSLDVLLQQHFIHTLLILPSGLLRLTPTYMCTMTPWSLISFQQISCLIQHVENWLTFQLFLPHNMALTSTGDLTEDEKNDELLLRHWMDVREFLIFLYKHLKQMGFPVTAHTSSFGLDVGLQNIEWCKLEVKLWLLNHGCKIHINSRWYKQMAYNLYLDNSSVNFK